MLQPIKSQRSVYSKNDPAKRKSEQPKSQYQYPQFDKVQYQRRQNQLNSMFNARKNRLKVISKKLSQQKSQYRAKPIIPVKPIDPLIIERFMSQKLRQPLGSAQTSRAHLVKKSLDKIEFILPKGCYYCSHHRLSKSKQNKPLKRQVNKLQSQFSQISRQVNRIKGQNSLQRQTTVYQSDDIYMKLCRANQNNKQLVVKLHDSSLTIRKLQDEIQRLNEQLKSNKLQVRRIKLDVSNVQDSYLSQRLQNALQYSDEIFGKYSNCLKQNNQLKIQLAFAQDQNTKFKEQQSLIRQQISSLRKTEYKLDHLEMSLSRIQDGTILQERPYRDQFQSKLDVISSCIQFVQNQLIVISKLLNPQGFFIDTPQLKFPQLRSVADLARFAPMKRIIERLDISQLLQSLIVGLVGNLFNGFQKVLRNIIIPLNARTNQLQSLFSRLQKKGMTKRTCTSSVKDKIINYR